MGRRAQGWQLRKRSNGTYSVRFVHDGQRIERSTGCGDPRRAGTIASRIYAEVVSGHPGRPMRAATSRTPLPVQFSNWLAEAESSLDESTAEQYKMYVKANYLPFFGSLEDITNEGGRSYVRFRLTRVKRKTVLKELSALRSFLRWVKEHGHLTAVPEIESPLRKERGTPKWNRKTVELDPEEVERILAALPERGRGGCFPRDFYTVMWETGLRTATLQQMRVPDDYAKGQGALTIRDEIDKARYGRELPLTERARAVLDRVAPEAGVIFGERDHVRLLRAAARRAGLPEDKVKYLSNHDFRHARATHLASSSQNLVGVAFLLGHKHITTTSLYAKPRQQAARSVLMAVGGISSEASATSSSSSTDSPSAHAEASPVSTPQPGPGSTDSGADSGARRLSKRLQGQIPDPRGARKPKHLNTVRKRGLEPPLPCGNRNLNPARLPVPPLSRESGRLG
jgi:integrase